jgi:hypothetical protein
VDSKHALRLDSAELYWFENGVKQWENNDESRWHGNRPFNLLYPEIYDSTSRQYVSDSTRPFLQSEGMMSIAADKGVDVFYIWYGNNQVDTLNVDATSEDIEESDCKHKRYHWNSITYRGGQLVTPLRELLLFY